MTVTEDQTGLAKDKLKKGDKVTVIKRSGEMVLVERNGTKYWINEKYLKG